MRKPLIPDENRRKAVKLFSDNEISVSSEVSENEIKEKISNEKAMPSKPQTKAVLSNLRTSANEVDEAEKKAVLSNLRTSKNEVADAERYAMLLVSRFSYTEKKLREKIKGKKIYSDDEIEKAVNYVKKYGYINDEKLAQNSIYSLADRLWGRKKIEFYLKNKGISSEIVEKLDFSEIDFSENCKKLAEKNKGKERNKLIRTLLAAGFTYDEVFDCVPDYDD